ncbi:LytR C-terminal domain-containing protein [bacterium]|nr:LytR C-terminal domain-containing protein [bacterium]
MKNRRGKSAFLGGIRDLALNLTIIALCVILVAFIWNFVREPIQQPNDVAGEGVDIGIPAINAVIEKAELDKTSDATIKAQNQANNKQEQQPTLLQRVYSLDLRNGTSKQGFAAHYKEIIESKTDFTIGKPENADRKNYGKTVIIDYSVDPHSVEELRSFLQLDATQVMTEKRPPGSMYFCRLILGDDAAFFAVNN